jgi:5-methylcytosine-specific restriction endonuclease McrA
MSRQHSKTTWRVKRLRRRDGDNCWVCGLVMRFDSVELKRNPGRIDVTVDHIRPRSAGGTSWFWNLALAHAYCNAGRHNNSVEQLRDVVAIAVCAWLAGTTSYRGPRRTGYVVDMKREAA